MFQKGNSGNPGGRKRSKGLGELLRARYGKDAAVLVEQLHQFAFPPKGKRMPKKIQADAIELLLAYHAGRPTQRMDVDTESVETLRVVMTDGTTDGDDVAAASGAEPGVPSQE